METFEILEKALALIEREENWCGSGWGEGHRGCALHAVSKVEGVANAARAGLPSYLALASQLPPAYGHVGAFNDESSHAEVVQLFQKAIAAEKRKAGVLIDVPAEAPQEVPA